VADRPELQSSEPDQPTDRRWLNEIQRKPEMRILAAIAFASAMIFGQIAVTSSAYARCTNSYDTASDGSSCGGRASGCRSGGRGGYC